MMAVPTFKRCDVSRSPAASPDPPVQSRFSTNLPVTRHREMKAFLITPDTQSIEDIEVDSLDDLKVLIGFDTLESDAVGSEGDRLYFDEECFLRGASGRFQIDTLVPVSGKGVVLGTAGEGAELCDVTLDIEDLRRRTKFS
jgi:hypothetical protein